MLTATVEPHVEYPAAKGFSCSKCSNPQRYRMFPPEMGVSTCQTCGCPLEWSFLDAIAEYVKEKARGE